MPASDIAFSLENDLNRLEFWLEFFPELTITPEFSATRALRNGPSGETLGSLKERILEEGYFQEQDPGLAEIASRMGIAIKRCVEMGLSPTFLFLFDESWACFYRQHQVIASLIGEEYKILPDFWIWHVDPRAQESGWRPHRDKGRMSLAPDGSPLSLTMWIPMSEATPLNGCMYMVPADRDPYYNTPKENEGCGAALYDIRALPAKPGDFLCWNQAVMHWGAHSSKRAPEARMSMALEFQRGDITPFNHPILDPKAEIPFARRLKLVAKQILQYQHMYALSPEMQKTAQRILMLG